MLFEEIEGVGVYHPAGGRERGGLLSGERLEDPHRLAKGLFCGGPVHVLDVVVPVDVVEAVYAKLVAPRLDLPEQLRVLFGYLGAGQEESPHQRLHSIRLKHADPRRLPQKPRLKTLFTVRPVRSLPMGTKKLARTP